MIHRPLRLVVIVMFLTLAVLLVVISIPAPKSPAPVLPNPNGYDDFMRAGNLIVGERLFFATNTVEDLRSCLRTNEEALRLLHQGLKKECRIALDFSTNYLPARMLEIGMTKRLAQLMVAEGKLAEREGRTNDAATAYLDVIRFGNEAVRGGVMIDRLVGIACESMGTVPLERILASLDSRTCRESVNALQPIDKHRESPADVLKQEKEWTRRNATLRERLITMIPAATINPIRTAQQKFIARVQQQVSSERQLMIKLASRAYELEKGRLPSSPQDLVPEYLKRIPNTNFGLSNTNASVL